MVRAVLAILLGLFPDRLVPVSPASLTVVEAPVSWPDTGDGSRPSCGCPLHSVWSAKMTP